MMKTAVLSLVAVAASASPGVVHLHQGNPPDINDYSRLRGVRELGKREHKDAVEIEESLIQAMEAEAALVDAVKTETALVQDFAKAEKKRNKKEKRERAKEKKDKQKKRDDTKPPIPGEGRRKKQLKTEQGDAPPPILMAKTSKPTSNNASVSAPVDPKKREWSKTTSPSTSIPSFQPTISPTTELNAMESVGPTSLAPITSEPTVLVITPAPTVAPTTSAPVANDPITSLPTFMPSYSPTGGEEGDVVEATPNTQAPSSFVAVPVNSTATPVTSAPMSSPPTSATSSVATGTIGDVASTPTTPAPSSSSMVTAPPLVNSTTPNDASEIIPDCPDAYDTTKTNYVGGDEATVNEHIFECQAMYEKYCNIPEWYDSLLTFDANAKQSWDDAWMHVGPCVAVTSDEV